MPSVADVLCFLPNYATIYVLDSVALVILRLGFAMDSFKDTELLEASASKLRNSYTSRARGLYPTRTLDALDEELARRSEAHTA